MCATPSSTAHRATPAGAGARRAAAAAAVSMAAMGTAAAYTVNLNPANPMTVYLQVGVGSFTNDYIYGGQPGKNATVNTVSTTVASGALGNGAAQAMTTDSTATISYWDGYTYCSVPDRVYIGGFYRTAGGSTGAAQVTAIVPPTLTDAAGDTISPSKITWTSNGNGDHGTEVFPGGTFVGGGVQNVGSMSANTWTRAAGRSRTSTTPCRRRGRSPAWWSTR